MNEQKILGYLPHETPSFGKLLLFALQQIIVMFPATVLVALLTGFHVSTTIFASGLATICFILITKKKIPLYYGSSFSYIAAILSITKVGYGEIAADALISQAQFGIILSGLVSIGAGLIVKRFSMSVIEKVLPPTVTGSIAIVIGLSLAKTALENVTNSYAPGVEMNLAWLVAFVALIVTVICSVFVRKGTIGQLPILIGLLSGYLVAGIITLVSQYDFVDFGKLPNQGLFIIPHFTLPTPSWTATIAIMPIAIATIPESTAHLCQLDLYVNKLAEEKGQPHQKIADLLGLNLIGDGLGDMISGLIGGPAGTNYGENISTMSITKNFSVKVLMGAAIMTMIISFFGPLSAAVYSIPNAVICGISIYLFGVIAIQGVAIMNDRQVSLFDPKNLAIIASILILGLGGSYLPGGMIPLFGIEAPAIATAAIFGILLNLLFKLIETIINKRKTKQA
ncbi:MAG TPA: solute carrier family 23 protein [Bacilli bacterium]|jgi:uracil permease|nr:xanthine permease [Acholeplasmataceae bacterium]HNZ77127.1 solute carrier family 23 protein [Bacilli bacterium]HOD60814.1 solute carrier family 23 protein [Bacilli bacterium]HOE06615.1 solute carrier family 23 protein [Bacilli bacterium]HOH61945.1 solute carrier family 23 protein [Bacilli bacterium]